MSSIDVAYAAPHQCRGHQVNDWAEPRPNRVSEAERVATLASYGILDTPVEQDFDDLVEIAAQVCKAPIAVVNLVTDMRQFFKAEVGLGVRETPLETSFCRHALLEKDFLQVSDAALDPRFDGNPLVHEDPKLRFYAGALVKNKDGVALGTMCVLDFQPRTLDEHQIRTLKLLARQAMVQIELRRAAAEREESIADLQRVMKNRALVARELSHRIKNVLGLVQAIIGQSFRTTSETDYEQLEMILSERIAALSRAQDIFSQDGSPAKYVRCVVETVLAPHGTERMTFDGPQVALGEQQSLGLSLALHELATNAAKYGALSSPDGRVALTWSASADGAFGLHWIESGGPTVEEPTRNGFGTRILSGIVGQYFSGQSHLEYRREGLYFALSGSLETD
jgi:two-component sensor histidine kinase